MVALAGVRESQGAARAVQVIWGELRTLKVGTWEGHAAGDGCALGPPRCGMLRWGAKDPILSLLCCLLEGPETHAAHLSDSAERKQCYYHISDVRLCDSVLAKNITKEECCCTVGAAWGDNCETYPCPIPGTGRTVAPPHQARPVLCLPAPPWLH